MALILVFKGCHQYVQGTYPKLSKTWRALFKGAFLLPERKLSRSRQEQDYILDKGQNVRNLLFLNKNILVCIAQASFSDIKSNKEV